MSEEIKVLKVGDTFEDERGVWEVLENGGTFLIEPSQTWIDRNTMLPNLPPEPTLEDYLLEMDFRLSNIELGL